MKIEPNGFVSPVQLEQNASRMRYNGKEAPQCGAASIRMKGNKPVGEDTKMEEVSMRDGALVPLPVFFSESYDMVPWERALCRRVPSDGVNFIDEPFYQNGRAGALLTEETRRAISVCLSCPIRQDCDQYANEEETGVWGGRTRQMRHQGKPLDDRDRDWLANNLWTGSEPIQ